MRPVLLLLFLFAFSVLARQDQITHSQITPVSIDRVSAELQPSQPEIHPSQQFSQWKKYWVDHTAVTQIQIGQFVTCQYDDSSDSPIYSYSTRTKSSGKKKH